MIKQLIVCFLVMSIFTSRGVAQQNAESLKWLEITLFHPKIFNKIFFDYDANNRYGAISPSGKCAFILPDSIFRSVFPKIFHQIDRSWVTEQMLFTTSLIKNEDGSLYASAYFTDVEIETWIRFDKFDVSDKQIKITLHTTDYSGKSATESLKYYKVNALLEKFGSEWRIKKIQIKQIGCCDDRKDFSKGFRRDY